MPCGGRERRQGLKYSIIYFSPNGAPALVSVSKLAIAVCSEARSGAKRRKCRREFLPVVRLGETTWFLINYRRFPPGHK
jgi:hypothetical protein